MQVFAQLGAIVGLVAEHPFRRLHSANEALCDRAIVRFTSGQQDGDKAPFNICECVNLRVAPSARAASSPLFHLLPSGALSRAWSRSSACRWIVRSQQVPGTGFPRRRAVPSAQSGYRREDHTQAGNRTSDSRCTCTIPLIARRSSTRSTPRTSVGKRGSISIAHRSANRFLRTIPIPFQKRIRIVLSERKN